MSRQHVVTSLGKQQLLSARNAFVLSILHALLHFLAQHKLSKQEVTHVSDCLQDVSLVSLESESGVEAGNKPQANLVIGACL